MSPEGDCTLNTGLPEGQGFSGPRASWLNAPRLSELGEGKASNRGERAERQVVRDSGRAQLRTQPGEKSVLTSFSNNSNF